MNIAEQVAALKPLIGKLPANKQDFARSLVQQFERRGTLNDRPGPSGLSQMDYIGRLLAQASTDKPEPQTAEVGDFGGVIALFKAAKAKLKFPKITLQVQGEAVILKLAGQQSKAPGAVYVVSEGGYGNATFYGRISPEGIFEQSGRAQAKLETTFGLSLVDLLRDLAKEPIKVVQAQAQLTGNCIFCNKHLTDDRSKAAGFGPVCAEKWNLYEAWKVAAKVGPQTLATAVPSKRKRYGKQVEIEEQAYHLVHPINEYEAQLFEEEEKAREEEVNHSSNEDCRYIYRTARTA